MLTLIQVNFVTPILITTLSKSSDNQYISEVQQRKRLTVGSLLNRELILQIQKALAT
jgi:hypothetical protein